MPFIKCLVRGKEIRLTPEEAVRQMFIRKLIDEYGYRPAQMSVEHAIHFGREVKRADIVIFEQNRPNVEYIIVEVKKPKLKDGKEQLKSYCNATGATMGVWTNGEKISFYHRKDPNYFEDIPDIPNSMQKLKDILHERRTIENLIAEDKLLRENKTLADLILEMEDEVLANAGVDVFEEVFKLIYTKLYDEMMSGRDKARVLEFWNYGETDAELKNTIQNLFDHAKEKWSGVFADDDRIRLTPSHLSICVSSLQGVKLFNSNLDVIDDAFEYLMSKSQKGEKGQFFTPRYVIDMCVKMLNPKVSEKMIDTAAGSCGFPVHTTFYVWKKILEERGIAQSHLFSLERKPPECEDYVSKNVFAIDFDEKTVRVARTLNLIAGDGKTNVLHLNTLDYERWDEVIDENWRDIYNDGWKALRKLRVVKDDNSYFNFDIVMANPPFAGDIKESRIIAKYELGKNSKGKVQSKVGRDILFIERNLNFLKPGGRMAIVLPQGRFNNSSDKYIRDFIAERCRILAVVGLHGNVFKPHTGTKTSVLFVQKWDDKLCPQREDYPIFFATMCEPSKDNSGEKILEMSDGKLLRDKHDHTIVKHDLFNHDGLTRDGIAEAFIEFAKREGLSFFDRSSFDELKYRRLSEELECTEIFLSEVNKKNRADAEFFQKFYLAYEERVNFHNALTMGELTNFLIGPFGSSYDTSNYVDFSDYRYVRGQDVKPFFVSDNSPRYVSPTDFNRLKKYALQEGDILISVVGTLGNACIVQTKDIPAIFSCKSTVIRPQRINPYYLLTYLNSSYGRTLLLRNERGAIQKGLNLDDLKRFFVPTFSETFYVAIKEFFLAAKHLRERADESYHAAEKMLSAALGLENFKPSTQNVAIKSFSASFGVSGRLDAEFYQPKHDDSFNFLRKLNTTSINAEYEIFKNSGTNYSEVISDIGVIKTKQVKNDGIDIEGVESYFSFTACAENKSVFLRCGDVIFASMGVGSLGKVSLFTYAGERKFVTDSTLRIYRAKKNSQVRPEVLCLFLQSSIAQQLIYRYVVGSTGIINIYDDDMAKIPIPVVSSELQEKIAAQVAESFSLRDESEKMLCKAKRAVEIAIECGEEAAINFLSRDDY